jgi:hypothetical protein
MIYRPRLVTLLGLSLSLAVSGTAMAANSFSKNPNPSAQPFGGSEFLPPGPATITQSTNTSTITVGNSVSCNAGGLHTDNSYFRAFTLSAFNPPLDQLQFLIQNVTFGIEQATSTAATQPITVRLFDSSANPPTNATIGAAISTQAIALAPQAGTIFSQNLTVQPVLLNASDILAVEVFTPNGQTAGNGFFIGSNALGQSGPSFIRAADCGLADIGNLAGIGFPNMHIVMTVSGNNQAPVELQTFEIR